MSSKEVFTAPAILALGAAALQERAASRDQPTGERSMSRTVEMFNAYAGGDRRMSETDGWMFMVFLKAARAAQGKVNEDDYVDGAAYFALAGESATRSSPNAAMPTCGPDEVPARWIEWHKGFEPPRGEVEVQLRDGQLLTDDARCFLWGVYGGARDIVAYRLLSEP